VPGKRAGQRFDATFGVTTEALLFLGELDPEAIGPPLEHATHYSPTPIREALALLDAAPLAPDRTTFVDAGAGLGRVVMLAARRPFRAVVGVEVSPALAQIARENLAVWERKDAQRVARDVRMVRADAAAYAFPRGDLCVYLFNPFGAPVLETMLANLMRAGDRREVALLYHTPVERATVESTGRFALIEDLGFGLVYRMRP